MRNKIKIYLSTTIFALKALILVHLCQGIYMFISAFSQGEINIINLLAGLVVVLSWSLFRLSRAVNWQRQLSAI